MKYNNYPTKINNVSLPVPAEWTETSEVMENVNTTEAGTDIVDVMRVDKLTVNAAFDVSSTWLATFKGWNNSLSALKVKIYDSVTDDYAERDMRMRNFYATLVKHSDKNSGTVGLWTVTFDLIEF